MSLIRQLNREDGTAFLLSSHQLPYLEQICSHIAILHQGRIARQGELSALLADTTTQVLVRCDGHDKAISVIDELPGARVIAIAEDEGYLGGKGM